MGGQETPLLISEIASTVESIFDEYTLEDIHSEIQDVYLNYPYPWVIGYSGGKDSTTTLQLIWYAISELPEEKRDKPIYRKFPPRIFQRG